VPDSVSFRITTYTKLAKGESGLTQMNSARLCASEVIDWVLNELPEDAVTISHDESGHVTTTVIDWSLVPDHVRYPKMPGRMLRTTGMR
jgi:hypothetical protein